MREVREAWASFLSDRIKWEVFGTLTFRRSCPEEAVERSLRAWLREWATENTSNSVGRSWAAGRRGWWVAGIEPHQSRRLHAHVLLAGGCGHWDRRRAWEIWYRKWGMAKIEPCLDSESASEYLSKYVLGPTSEIVVGNLPPFVGVMGTDDMT